MGSELESPFDEAWATEETPRPHYAALLAALGGVDLDALSRAVAETLDRDGVSFGPEPFVVDAIPRIITAKEWTGLERGLSQRARALNRFLLDAYGEQEVVKAGIVPRGVIEEAEGYESDLQGRLPPYPWPAAIVGFDVVRAPDGAFLVLEDNLRTPSGIAYALAARAALAATLPAGIPPPRPVEPLAWELLSGVLRAAAPEAIPEPRSVVLTDGPGNVAFYEHARAAEACGAILATPRDLVREGDHLYVRDAGGSVRSVDVVYRRTNADCLRDERDEFTDVGELLLEPWLSGHIGLINAFGNGVADDKLVHGHVEDFIRFYLDEEPLLRSVPTTHVDDDPHAVVERLDELVVKPRHSHGGIGVVLGSEASEEELEEVAADLLEDPAGFISQPTVSLSVHPTILDGRLQRRHVDLRPFTFAGEDVAVLPGGLSRVAFDEGALIVNSSQNGGGKDTWVMPA